MTQMTESDFWNRLEYRLCYEMTGVDEWYRDELWCDGIHPEAFALGSSPPTIIGQAWIGRGGRHQEQWAFTLVLPHSVTTRDGIPWAELLPADDVTAWLDMDPSTKHLRIEPGIAVPDGPEVTRGVARRPAGGW